MADDNLLGGASSSSSSHKKPPANSKPRMMGIGDLQKGNKDENNYYAGGEKSGMAIEGSNRSEHDIIRKIFEQSQKVPLSEAEDDEKVQEQQNFKGRPHKLSEGENNNNNSNEDYSGQVTTLDRHERVTRTLTFWKNGFTVAPEGPLYEYEKPENQEILKTLQSGQAPLSLFQVLPGQAVDVNVSHKMMEDFSPPKISKPAFSGKGQRLGDLAEPTQSVVVDAPKPINTTSNNQIIQPEFTPSQPITSLQLRFADGTRSSGTFNSTQTVAQLYDYVRTVSERPFALLAGCPPKKLSFEDGRTLEEAQLLNCVVIQQWI